MKKKFLSILLMMGLVLVACSGGEGKEELSEDKKPKNEATEQVEDTHEGAKVREEQEENKDGESIFQVAIDYMPERLSPDFGSESMITIISPIFDPLFWDTKDGFDYRLADDVSVSEDGLIYTLHINEDAVWSDGEEITSDDILFSIDYSDILSQGASPYKLSSVNGEPIEINKLDDYTIEFKLPVEDNYFHANLGFMSVLPSHPFEGDASKVDESDYFTKPGMATSGAFEVVEVNADSLVYTARDDYYRGNPKTDKVIMKLLGTGTSRNVAFESGEVSYCRINDENDLEKYKSMPDEYSIVTLPGSRVNYLQINPEGSVMKDMPLEARKAIFMALDQDEIIQAVYGSQDLAEKANSIIVPECYDHNPDNKTIQYDLEKAKKLAEESGLTGKTLKYIYNKDREGMEDTSVIVQQELAKIGVNVEIRGLDSPMFFKELFTRSEDDTSSNWDIAQNLWGAQIGTRNYSYFYLKDSDMWGWSEEVSKTAIAYNAEPDLEKRKDISYKMQELATQEAWMFPLNYPNVTIVTRPNVKGLASIPISLEFGDYMNIEVD